MSAKSEQSLVLSKSGARSIAMQQKLHHGFKANTGQSDGDVPRDMPLGTHLRTRQNRAAQVTGWHVSK